MLTSSRRVSRGWATPCLALQVPVSFVRHRVSTRSEPLARGSSHSTSQGRTCSWHWGHSQFSCESPFGDAGYNGNRTQRQDNENWPGYLIFCEVVGVCFSSLCCWWSVESTGSSLSENKTRQRWNPFALPIWQIPGATLAPPQSCQWQTLLF